ncbi:MAG TPA: phospholipase domain-containing protein, partial [Steroidobacteraceae bacterium]
EAGKKLTGTWSIASAYNLSVYGPNGFARYFKGSIGSNAAILDVQSICVLEDFGLIGWTITNVGAHNLTVNVLDAYSGNRVTRLLQPHAKMFEAGWPLPEYFGWYDLVVTVAQDATFEYRLAGHVETGRDIFSDPALGGLVTLKA